MGPFVDSEITAIGKGRLTTGVVADVRLLSSVCPLVDHETTAFSESRQPGWSQANGFSPVWVLLWTTRLPLFVKAASQPGWSQAYGFSPVCVLLCFTRLPLSVKAASQPGWSQTNGFSPVCVLLWVTRVSLLENAALQPGWSHANGFSPVCVLMWLHRWSLRANAASHPGWSQTNCFSPVRLLAMAMTDFVCCYVHRLCYVPPTRLLGGAALESDRRNVNARSSS